MDCRAVLSSEITNQRQGEFVEALSSNVIFEILKYLTFSEAYTFLLLNKALYTIYESDAFWQAIFGAGGRKDFIDRLIVLDKDLQSSIIAATIKIAEGELTQHILNIPLLEKVPYIFPDSDEPAGFYLRFFSNKKRVIALREGLVTLNQILKDYSIYDDFFKLADGLHYLRDAPLREWLLQHTTMICERGLTILREKLLSRVEIENIYATLATYFLNGYGLIALREKLITAEQITLLVENKKSVLIDLLLSDEGIEALRQKRITPEWVAELPPGAGQLQSVLEEVKSKFINALVKDRLGNCFSYSDITVTFDRSVLTYHSTITAHLPQAHPAVKAACEKLENPGFTLNTKDIDGISTEITINHTERDRLKNVLKAMLRTETFEPETPSIDNADNHTPGLFYFSFFATPLAGVNANAVQEEANRHSDVSTVKNNQPT